MAKKTNDAPAKAGVAAELAAALAAETRRQAEASLRRLQPQLEVIAAASRAAAEEEAALGGLTQDQLEKLVLGEKRLRQLAQSLRDRREAHQRLSAQEGAELKVLRESLKQARRLGLTASNEAVKAAEERVKALEAAKATRARGIREVIWKAARIMRGLRSLPVPGGWKPPAEGPVAELAAACKAAAKEAGRRRAEGQGRKPYSVGPEPARAMEAAFKAAS